MKLRKLEIHNIASIEDAVIDFEKAPLSDSNVVLITGETGAGKSTLLDAICLALYATTPRLANTEMDGKWQENDNDSMDITDTMQLMRKNTTDAYSRLWFLGSDGNEYKAEWHVERKRIKLDRTWTLQNLTHPEASPQPGNGVSNIKGIGKDKEMMEAILAAIGLTFDQFCRTTMLAQGEFTRFLKCSNEEKAAILEKITNTEQYSEIGMKVHDLTNKKYKKEMEDVDPEKKEQAMTPEQRAETEAKRDEIGKELESLDKQLATAQNKEKWLSMQKTLSDNLEKTQEALTNAKKEIDTDNFKALQQNVSDWDATDDARKSLTAINEANATINQAKQQIEQLKSKYVTLLNGKEFVLKQIESFNNEIRKIDEEIKAEGGQPASKEQLENKFNDLLALAGNINLAKERVNTYFNKHDERVATGEKLVHQKEEIDNKTKEFNELTPKVENAKKSFDALDVQYERLNLAADAMAEKLRANLREGKQCPICGQTVKSLDDVPHEQFLKNLVKDVKNKRDDAKNNYDQLNELLKNCTIWLKQNKPTYDKDLKAYNEDQSLENVKNAAIESLEKCNISQPLDEQTIGVLEQAKVNAEQQRKELDAKIKRAERHDNLQRALEETKVHKEKVLNDTIEGILKDLPEWSSLKSQSAVELGNIAAATQSLSNSITSVLTNKNTATKSLYANQAILDNFLKEHTEITLERLKQLLQLKEQIAQQRKYIDEKRQIFATAQGSLETINRQIEEHQKSKPELAEGDSIENLQTAIAELKEQADTSRNTYGSIEQQLNDDDKRKEELAGLKAEFEKRKAIYEKWRKLDKLIGDGTGDKFRLIAQSYILANLVNAANVHMRSLTDRYTLHTAPGQDLIILVEDAYQGGVRRPASTISGGESFLVSLALALALSEIGQSLKVETLFIDEGFGTLSGEPLHKAINTLETLRASNNRQVYAISHRDEVKECIPVQIQVIQQDNKSCSRVEVVAG